MKMGIFTRFRDIISSNINAMLDRAEDPEKLIKLMIREMEDTLVEIKAACAGAMAGRKKAQRQLETLNSRAQYWEEKAELAVTKGRDDLAREALVEKRRYTRRKQDLDNELADHENLIAAKKKRAQEEIRRIDSSEAIMKFDELENRIERMESEADLVNFAKKSSLEEEFDRLSVDEEIEEELQALKTTGSQKDEPSSEKDEKTG
jgi:phage shock protein A